MNPSNTTNDSPGFGTFEHEQVKEFLENCRLLDYYPIFIAEGFESLEAIMEITEDDLVAMQVKRGHRRVIQRAIATIRGIPSHQSLFIPNNITTIVTNPSLPQTTHPYDKFYQSTTNDNDAYLTSGYDTMRSSQSDRAHTTSIPPPVSTPVQTKEYQLPPIEHVIRGLKLAPSSSPLSYVCYPEYKLQEEQGSSGRKKTTEPKKEDNFNSVDTTKADHTQDVSSDNSSVDHLSVKRKYRRLPKPDKHAPIKPSSAYIMFSNDARSELKHKNMSFVEMAKLVGDRWKSLSNEQKQGYERTAMKAKDEYLNAMHAYKQTDQYKNYQAYLNDFKNEQEATNRKIIRLRKKAKRNLSER
ncbi:hypothetical protein EDC96DRAFT_491917 [Choanephora cucurbitarum]|nr:hypothetical protein EDC96DRAFT_491917 [Choanephora cucurbitarum]